MRSLRMLCVLAAAAFLLAGCGKSVGSWVNPLRTKGPSEWRAGTDEHGPRRIARPALGSRAASYRVDFDRAARRTSASDEIARRMEDDLREWEASTAEAAAGRRERAREQEITATSNGASAKPPVARFDPSDLIVAKRRRSAEYINSQLRIAVLESRLTSASDVEKAAISARLGKAKDDLKAMDAASEDEAAIIKASRSRSNNANGTSDNSVGHEAQVLPVTSDKAGASNAR